MGNTIKYTIRYRRQTSQAHTNDAEASNFKEAKNPAKVFKPSFPAYVRIPKGSKEEARSCKVPINPPNITSQDKEDLFLCCEKKPEDLQEDVSERHIRKHHLEYITEGMNLGKKEVKKGKDSWCAVIPRWTYRKDPSSGRYKLVFAVQPRLGEIHQESRDE